MRINRHTARRGTVGARRWLIWVGVAAAAITAVGVFALPWLVHAPLRRIVSDAQALGFNNRVAVLAMLAGCIVFGLLGIVSRRVAPPAAEPGPVVLLKPVPADERVSWRMMLLMCGIAVPTIAVVAILVGRYPYADSGYLVDKLLYLANGSRMIHDFEFSYGPLLLYPPYVLWLAFRSLGLSIYAAYYVCAAVAELLSLLISAYLLNRLAMSPRLRRLLFAILAVIVIIAVPTFGPNYSALRFALPLVLLIWTMQHARSGILALVLPSVSVVAALLVSPEVGIVTAVALAAGIIAASGLDRWRNVLGALFGFVALIGGMFVYAASSDSALAGFASGNANFPVFPGQPAVLFVVMMLAVSGMLGYSLTWQSRRSLSPQVGWMFACVVFIAPALGRSDWIHVFWNGFGAFLLLVALLELFMPRLSYGATFSVALVYLVSATTFLAIVIAPLLFISGVSSGAISEYAVKGYTYRMGRSYPAGEVWYRKAKIHEIEPFYVEWLSRQEGVVSISWLSGRWGETLAESHALLPMYEPLSYIGTQAQLDRSLESIRAAHYLIVPKSEYAKLRAVRIDARNKHWGVFHESHVPTGAYVGMPSYFPLNMQPPNPVLDPQLAAATELHKNWSVYLRSGDFYILHQKGK